MISNPPSERRWRSINRAEVDALCLIRKRNSWKRSIRKRNEEKTTKFPFTFTRPKFLPPPKKKKNKILLKYKNTKSLRLQKAFRYLVNSPPPNIEPNIEEKGKKFPTTDSFPRISPRLSVPLRAISSADPDPR